MIISAKQKGVVLCAFCFYICLSCMKFYACSDSAHNESIHARRFSSLCCFSQMSSFFWSSDILNAFNSDSDTMGLISSISALSSMMYSFTSCIFASSTIFLSSHVTAKQSLQLYALVDLWRGQAWNLADILESCLEDGALWILVELYFKF